MPPHQTNAINVFVKLVEAVRDGVTMTPRSASDKEYFFQDWFSTRLSELSLGFEQQGRNSYPDYWVGSAPIEGFELKSLRFVRGRPARKDIDFNSTIPSGRKQGRDVFLEDVQQGKRFTAHHAGCLIALILPQLLRNLAE